MKSHAGKMKRSDITDRMVCEACLKSRTDPRPTIDILFEMAGGTPKLCLRAIERAISHGYCDSDTSDRNAYLTEDGERLLHGETVTWNQSQFNDESDVRKRQPPPNR